MLNELMIKVHHVQMVGALLGGMVLQYVFGQTKGFRVLLVIVLATVFLALFILTPFMEWANNKSIFGVTLKLGADDPLRVVVYALSSLISVELIAMIITLLPTTIRHRLAKSMGVASKSLDEATNDS